MCSAPPVPAWAACLPKLLIAAAEARYHALHTDPFGVHLDKSSVTVNGEEVMHRVKSERDRFVGFVLSDVEEWPADKRIMGEAKFIDEHTVQIDDHTQISAGRIVIATGSPSGDSAAMAGFGATSSLSMTMCFQWQYSARKRGRVRPGRDWLGNRPSLAPLGC